MTQSDAEKITRVIFDGAEHLVDVRPESEGYIEVGLLINPGDLTLDRINALEQAFGGKQIRFDAHHVGPGSDDDDTTRSEDVVLIELTIVGVPAMRH